MTHLFYYGIGFKTQGLYYCPRKLKQYSTPKTMDGNFLGYHNYSKQAWQNYKGIKRKSYRGSKIVSNSQAGIDFGLLFIIGVHIQLDDPIEHSESDQNVS